MLNISSLYVSISVAQELALDVKYQGQITFEMFSSECQFVSQHLNYFA